MPLENFSYLKITQNRTNRWQNRVVFFNSNLGRDSQKKTKNCFRPLHMGNGVSLHIHSSVIECGLCNNRFLHLWFFCNKTISHIWPYLIIYVLTYQLFSFQNLYDGSRLGDTDIHICEIHIWLCGSSYTRWNINSFFVSLHELDDLAFTFFKFRNCARIYLVWRLRLDSRQRG